MALAKFKSAIVATHGTIGATLGHPALALVISLWSRK